MSKKILITVTDQQSEATGPLVEATGDKSLSDLVRRLLKEEAARVGAEWPDNMLKPEETIKMAYQARWPRRPDAGTRVIFVQGEDEFHGERRQEVTIEEADALASEILGESVQMRFNEDVHVDGPTPHTMRGSYMWIELVPPGSLR